MPDGPGEVEGKVSVSEVGEPVAEVGGEVAAGEVEEHVAEVTPASALRDITGQHTTEALTIPEYRAIEDEFSAKAVLEDLLEPHRSLYEAVRDTGAGLCATCRWLSGCHECDPVKAWSYYCRATLYEAMDERVMPKGEAEGSA